MLGGVCSLLAETEASFRARPRLLPNQHHPPFPYSLPCLSSLLLTRYSPVACRPSPSRRQDASPCSSGRSPPAWRPPQRQQHHRRRPTPTFYSDTPS